LGGVRKPVFKVCEWCGEEYATIPSHAARRRYCSVECAGHGRRRDHASERKCPNCGKRFVVQSWNPKWACSKKCVDAMKTHRVTKRCEVCGKEYEAPWNRRRTSRYCSLECLARAKRKVRYRPKAHALAALLVHHTLDEIGVMYGVTANAVRYWCRRYGLKWPSKGERNRLQRLKPRERDALAQKRAEEAMELYTGV